MLRKINVYVTIKGLFILIAFSLILIMRVEDQGMDLRERSEALESFLHPNALRYLAIRLLSFGILFAACFDLKAAVNKKLRLNNKRFIAGIIVLVISLIDFYRLTFNDGFNEVVISNVLKHFYPGIGIRWMQYSLAMRELSFTISALAGFLCGSAFKTEVPVEKEE